MLVLFPDVELPVELPAELFVVLPDVLDPVVLDVPLLEPVVLLDVVAPPVLPVVLDVVFPVLVEELPAPLDVSAALLDVLFVPTSSVSDLPVVKVADAVLPEESLAVTW